MGSIKHLSFALLLLLSTAGPGQEKAKPDAAKPAEGLTGAWRGVYHYPQGDQQPVRFELLLLQADGEVGGVIKEPNTFGSRPEPFLAAVFRGRFDGQTGKLTFTKTYDGTAGPNHDVEYAGTLSKDGDKVEGTWDIGGFSGTFTLEKVKDSRPGPFTGLWSGLCHYPKEKGLAPLKFQLIVVHQGEQVTGLIKEMNTTVPNKEEPYLHSTFQGRFDAKVGKLTFTKTYDGTAGEKHSVKCDGKASFDQRMIEGFWTGPDGVTGRLTLHKRRLDGKTLAGVQ